MIECNQVHEFNCLLKKEDDDYLMEVMEIPGIAIGSTNKEVIIEETTKAIQAYLKSHDEIHIKVQRNTLESSLRTSSKGIIQGIEQISIRC